MFVKFSFVTDDDLSLQDKAKKSSQKRALSKSIMDDLRKEYFDGPEEVYVRFSFS